MKALTLTQPWATAIALGLKAYETRSWGTGYRGPLAIHASREVDSIQVESAVRSGLAVPRDPDRYPRSTIVAVAQLTAVVREVPGLTDAERFWGDFSQGRYFWRLENVVRVVPVACRGHLGLWDVPDDLARRIASVAMGG